MDELQAIALLSDIGNENLLQHWTTLNPEQKQHLFLQLQRIDRATLRLQQKMIDESQTKNVQILPFSHYSKAGNPKDKHLGQEMISEGLAGCLIVAGGQGSRLRIEGPKGVCRITKIRKKSLFQLFAEKTLAAGKQANNKLPLAIMTSPQNHGETLSFFEHNHFFGLDPNQLSFFQQKTLPLLNRQGNLFLETQDTLSEGPDGNGGALHDFFKSGIWDKWYSKGVRYLNFVLIDNALADPFDAELIGYQKRNNSDIVVKCTSRKNPEESVGILVQENGKAAVIEYSEFSQEERTALNPNGSLRHLLANLSSFSFTMEFVKLAATTQSILHKSFKAAKFLDSEGHTTQAEKPMAWKFEKFIFDNLPLASKVDALLYPRETCFAPLKNYSGCDSRDTVVEALQQNDQHTMSAITGKPCHLAPLEIAPEFYYPTQELLNKWKGKAVTQSGYIES